MIVPVWRRGCQQTGDGQDTSGIPVIGGPPEMHNGLQCVLPPDTCLPFIFNIYILDSGGHVTTKTSTKAIAALTALKALQEDAKRKGLDKLTMDEINAEIANYRREKRLKNKSHSKNR